jgi:hypothetical protein
MIKDIEICSSVLREKVKSLEWLPHKSRKNFLFPIKIDDAFTTYDEERKICIGVYKDDSSDYYYFESRNIEKNQPHVIYFQKKIKYLSDLNSIWQERVGEKFESVSPNQVC